MPLYGRLLGSKTQQRLTISSLGWVKNSDFFHCLQSILTESRYSHSQKVATRMTLRRGAHSLANNCFLQCEAKHNNDREDSHHGRTVEGKRKRTRG